MSIYTLISMSSLIWAVPADTEWTTAKTKVLNDCMYITVTQGLTSITGGLYSLTSNHKG